MADVKVTAFPALAAPALTDVVPVVDMTGPTTKQSLLSAIRTAFLPIALAGAEVNGTLPVAKGGTGITAFAAGIATFLGTSSGANLAAALTSALPASKGGTGLTALAAGIATFLGTSSGANLAAALTSALPASKGGTGVTALTAFVSAIVNTADITGSSVIGSGVANDASTGVTLNDVATAGISMLRYTDAAPPAITGFANGVQGKRILIVGVAGSNFVMHEDVGSVAANRCICYAASSAAYNLGTPLEFVYDGVSSRWRQVV